MWCVRLDLVVLCVWASVTLCWGEPQQGSSRSRSPVQHYVYPRTGRLFHADYERDNEIFRSLDRTNFMRRGQSRAQEAEEKTKKHVYVRDGRIPVEIKKTDLVKEKGNPTKAILFKVSKVVVEDPVSTGERVKRSAVLEDIDRTQHKTVVIPESPAVYKEEHADRITPDNKGDVLNKEGTPITENKVDCDNNSTVKNNDTDKTLFVHDSEGEVLPSVRRPEVEEGSSLMKKTVVDDSLKLYPVYRGVKYYYPQIERRLEDSPELTVSMNVPVVSEAAEEEEGNSTSGQVVEGRSKRPFKKLAFPLLLALKLKTAIMVPLILGLIGLISFKGLWSGLTALAIAAALGLKALVVGSGAKVLVHTLPPPPPPAHVHHLPPSAVEYAEYWSRRNDDHHNSYSSFSDYRPSSWS